MTTDFRALCKELTDALAEWELGGSPPEDTADADLVARARAALAAEPEPPVNCLDLLADALRLIETCPVTTDTDWIVLRMELLVRIRTALRAEPKPPSDAEVADPVIREYAGYLAAAYRNGFYAGHKHALTRAALAEQLVSEPYKLELPDAEEVQP